MLILKVYFISFIPFILSESFSDSVILSQLCKASVLPALSTAGLLKDQSLPDTNRCINLHHARTVFHSCLNQGVQCLFVHILLLKYDPLFQHKRKSVNTLKSSSEVLFLIRKIYFFQFSVNCPWDSKLFPSVWKVFSLLVCCANPGSCAMGGSAPLGVTILAGFYSLRCHQLEPTGTVCAR